MSIKNQSNLKSRINRGEQVIGVEIPHNLNKHEITSLVENDKYDFLWIDTQHRPVDEPLVSKLCVVAAEVGVDVIFRIRHTQQTYLIGNHLDIGPSGIEVPQVETESTVQEAIDYFYYPPFGQRSWGGIYRRAIDEIPDRHEYTKWWQEYGVLWMQMESVEGVTNVKKLAKKGVDCMSFGPNDLMYSIESHPNSPYKTVDDCIAHVISELRDTGTAVCFRIRDQGLRQKYKDMGVTVILEHLEQKI